MVRTGRISINWIHKCWVSPLLKSQRRWAQTSLSAKLFLHSFTYSMTHPILLKARSEIFWWTIWFFNKGALLFQNHPFFDLVKPNVLFLNVCFHFLEEFSGFFEKNIEKNLCLLENWTVKNVGLPKFSANRSLQNFSFCRAKKQVLFATMFGAAMSPFWKNVQKTKIVMNFLDVELNIPRQMVSNSITEISIKSFWKWGTELFDSRTIDFVLFIRMLIVRKSKNAVQNCLDFELYSITDVSVFTGWYFFTKVSIRYFKPLEGDSSKKTNYFPFCVSTLIIQKKPKNTSVIVSVPFANSFSPKLRLSSFLSGFQSKRAFFVELLILKLFKFVSCNGILVVQTFQIVVLNKTLRKFETWFNLKVETSFLLLFLQSEIPVFEQSFWLKS